MRSKVGYRYLLMLACVLVALSVPVLSQSGRGTITGTVTDSTGGLVPGVEVVATNMETGVETKGLTTDVGLYRLPYVQPGRYRVSASLDGFKTAVRENVVVTIAATVTVDFQLEVGDLSEQITVSTTAPLLEKSTSEIGTAATELEVHTWPILVDDGTRQLQSFIFRALPGTQGGGWEGSINGGQSFAHEILIDGISIGRMDLNGGSSSEFTPTMDAVGEFKLQTGATSAQYGNSQTGLTNFSMKSGTNEFHGSAFWFHQNEAFRANSWGNNTAGAEKQPFRLHNFGASVGGPIVKDRTHFFFSYEGNRQKNYNLGGFNDALPVAPFKQGDFSLLLDPAFTGSPLSGTVVGQDALGRDVIYGQIYDPASSRQLPDGTWIRDPFPGNIIPAHRFSEVTKNILQYDLPEPMKFQLLRNNPRVTTASPVLNIDNYSFKLDHVFSDSHKMGGSFVFNDRYRLRYGSGSHYYLPEPQIPGSPLAGDKIQETPGYIIRVSEDWTINPTMINHLAIGYNRFRNYNVSNSYAEGDGKDWAAELGLKNQGGATFPELRFGGFSNYLSGQYRYMGHRGTGNSPNGSVIVADDFSWIRGSHSFRFGGEHRRYYLNAQAVSTPGLYQFHNENTALPGFSDSTGFAYASFILGAVRNAGVSHRYLTPGIRSRTTAFYFQDDWRVTPNFTLNLGLRWDIPQPFTEAANRMSALNPNKPNPGADGFLGALDFTGDCPECNGETSFGEVYWKQFSPRIGFAYSPTNRMVLRGGFGINYAPPILDGWNYNWFNGFDASKNINARSRSRFNEDPSYHWDEPYPAYTGPVPNYDPALLNGDTISIYPEEANKWPMTRNWNFGIQYEMPWETKVEVNYVGSKGTRLNDAYLWSLNQLDPKYLSLGDALLDDIEDHPEIPKPYPSFEGTVAQALRPYPQFYGVGAHRLASGWSNYNSLQAQFTRRSSSGLSFLVSYTFSKAMGTADNAIGASYYGAAGQDIYNRKGDYSVSAYHVPHDLRITWIYQLPFGPNQRWLNSGVFSKILGGWTFSAIQQYRSGGVLALGAGGYEGEVLFNPGIRPDIVPGVEQKIGGEPSAVDSQNGTPYLNPDAFALVPKTDNNIPVRLGNAPRHLDTVRGFKVFNEDFSLIKRTNLGITEETSFELRLDALNVFNRIRPSDPYTDVNNPETFGRVFTKSGGPRTLQLGLRFNF